MPLAIGTRAAKVAHAQVVGRQRQPLAIGKFGAGDPVPPVRQVAGAGADAFAPSRRFVTRRKSAVSSVSIIMPRTLVYEVASGSHFDSW
jgi:hypothetical protein